MTFDSAPEVAKIAVAGPPIPVSLVCVVPGCANLTQDQHHLFRRTLLGKPSDWVEVRSMQTGKVLATLPNIAGICREHHRQVTENKARIGWVTETGLWVWDLRDGSEAVPLDPQPGHIHEQTTDGVCPACGRGARKRRAPADKKEPARRREVVGIRVPKDHENGAQILEDTLTEARVALGNEDEFEGWKYLTVLESAAFLLQHAHLLTREELRT